MRLHEATVDRYGPLSDCSPSCHGGLTVLSGHNETGKTLYLEAVLQLLDADVVDVLEPPLRVDANPTGRVVVEYDGQHHDLSGSTALSDITPVDVASLQTVFVVRDTDLAMPDHAEYYTGLIERLGDIHTSEIDNLVGHLRERGRLTEKRLNLSDQHDNAKSIHAEATALIGEIEETLGEIERDGLDALHGRRLRTERELAATRDEYDEVQLAKTVHDHQQLDDRLDTYRSVHQELADLEAFSEESLEELQELHRNIERDMERLEMSRSTVEELDHDRQQTEESLDDTTTQVNVLDARSDTVEQAREALETHRRSEQAAVGAARQANAAKLAIVAGLLGAGAVGGAGAIADSTVAIGFGMVLFVLTLLAAGVFYRANTRLSEVEGSRISAIASAQDAGLEVDAIEDIAPLLEEFDSELSQSRERMARLDEQHTRIIRDLEEERATHAELEEAIDAHEAALDEKLTSAGVESIDTFEERVNRRRELQQPLTAARQSLVDAFGEVDGDQWEACAAHWQERLDAMVASIDPDEVDPTVYDEQRLEELSERLDELHDQAKTLEERLETFDSHLDEIDRRASELNASSFIDRTLRLQSHSVDGLHTLRDDLERLIETLEDDAKWSRMAIDILSNIRQHEEQKLTELFDPEGPASRTFEQITAGRYTEVAYDANEHRLVTVRNDGTVVPATQLSQGARDQLYLATRVSLAQQLLGHEPGFFLMDDPLVTADPTRLTSGFEALLDLADDGWQILYLTAKEEVYRDMVDTFEIRHESLSGVGKNR